VQKTPAIDVVMLEAVWILANWQSPLWVSCGNSCANNCAVYRSRATSMTTKAFILQEIRRVAEEIGRTPGRQKFEKLTGIRQSEWYGVYWRSWGDAIDEAGFVPNEKQSKHSSDELLRHYAEAVRHFGRIPAEIDLRMYCRRRDDFPGHSTFANHFGSKLGVVTALGAWIEQNEEFHDLLELLPEVVDKQDELTSPEQDGFVYLLQSGAHFKIGRSDDIERRVKQISVALPEELELVHTIRTDDPSGIEAYWHRRFASLRANGEWFRLGPSEIRAFKRRKYQ
jgi:Meiotically up-regulated gene 113/Homing endonuclease associated repeat